MFQVNDKVSYGVYGVCTVTELTQKKFNGEWIDYYVLKPVYDNRSTVFVPVSNERLAAKMRKILTKEEIDSILRTAARQELIWEPDHNARKEKWNAILSRNDPAEIAAMLRCIYLQGQTLRACGKKMHEADEKVMREAEQMLHSEFAQALQLPIEQVTAYILKTVGENGSI